MRPLAFLRGVRLAADLDRLPVDILRPPERELDQPGPHRRVGHLVDQDEPAQIPIIAIALEHDAAIGVDFRHADIVQFERLRRQLGHRVDVDRVRSEEHTSELQSLMRSSYAGFCLKKKKYKRKTKQHKPYKNKQRINKNTQQISSNT